MFDAALIRQALCAFLGDEKFRKFVKQGSLRGRLRYWQEQEWCRFTTRHPELAVELPDLIVALRICELHGDELLPDTVPIYHGCVDYTQTYLEVSNRMFPHAAVDPVSTEGGSSQADCAQVWYCPRCRVAQIEWQAKQARTSNGLTRSGSGEERPSLRRKRWR